jgi:Raf kinase inhibitor-like YbhB/YbcL family protein
MKGGRNEIRLTSDTFTAGQPIPTKYTCDGADVSPPLQWSAAPAETKSFALIYDDPDVPMGTWVHWGLNGLPASTRSLPEKLPLGDELPNGARPGITDFKAIGYGEDYPPPGSPTAICSHSTLSTPS